MPRVQSAGSASTSQAPASTSQSLKRNQACHQCRKRKLKCNAQKPCATCAKSHRLAVASNPALSGTEAECTYDEFTPENPPPVPEGPRAKYQRLEARINELETLLKEQQCKEATDNGTCNNTPPLPQPSPLASLSPGSASSPARNLAVPSIQDTYHRTLFTDEPSPFVPTLPMSLPPAPAVDESTQQIIPHDWPSRLPAPDLLHHLIDVFFTCYPLAHYLLHRPTFMASLLLPPRSPAFPHSSLLHAICAYASIFSFRVHTPSFVPESGPFPRIDPEVLRDRDNSFAEKHVRWSRQARDDATSVGSNLIECTQSLVIMVGYYHLTARWVEVWASAGLAVRYCVPLGLNNRAGFHTARTHPRTWLRNGGRSILPDPDNAIEREQRANLFWIAYSYERFQTAVGPWAMCLDDEDISQLLPIRLDDYEAGNDVELNRQCLQTPNFLTTHIRETTDSFTLFVKASVILSKVKILSLRVGNRYPNIPDVRDTPAFRHLESTIATFRSTFPPEYLDPVSQTSKGFDTLLYVAHLIPHTAIILMHEEHANINSPNCLSTQKSLLAARAILDLIYLVCSTSYDLTRLPSVCTFCWFMAARVLVRVLKHRHQAGQISEAATMRSEVEVIKLAFQRMSEKIPIARRHRQMLDDLLEAELHNLDEVIYGTFDCREIFDPAYIHEGVAFDWPDQGPTLVEVTQETPRTISTSVSSHLATPEAGTVVDPGPILTDTPSSAQATLEQLLQSMDSNSFLLASGYADLAQFPAT
ncbi:Glutamate-ammonia-ligase adenylyltransferase [Rhizoctonia solani]|uniref:Glutamate-ammonia-ligase adenylyltransferase n=1 Tax=Rhizoctonia solani TaxID=456999 RepID=A0A0K6GEH1_9AGAM|nr:Glutamate-ammonia-ligase adenylyltransferase [Rhizoctonia solani]